MLNRLLSPQRLQYLVALCCACIFIGLVGSRALASIGMIALVVTGVFSQSFTQTLRNYFSRKEMWILSLFFFIVLISGLYSDNKTEWLVWVRIKLPYLFLPIAMAGLPKLTERTFTIILYAFVLTMFISALFILSNYALHYTQITEAFTRGSAIPMPFSHIRYTLMLAFSFFCAWYLAENKRYLFSPSEKYAQWFFMAFVFVALHILSVRSGLLALYIGLLFIVYRVVIAQRRFMLGVIALAILVSLPVLTYYLVPSFHNKVSYMRYDLDQYRSGQINENSDAGRLLSWRVGMEIWQQHKLTGIGAGDIRTETAKVYEQQYPQVPISNRKVPHNQFIWVMATTGFIGLLLFLTAFFLPVFTNGYFKYWLFTLLHLILFSSFFTEDTLEEQVGTAFYLIFLLLFINHFHPADE